MKKIVIIGLVLVGLFAILSANNTYQETGTTTVPTDTPTVTPIEATLPTQFTMTVPETDVSVTISPYTGNTVEYGDFEGNPQAGYGTVTMMPEFLVPFEGAYVGTFAVNSGGSGEMIYLGYFVQGEASYQLESSVMLGDRVDVTDFMVNGSNIEVTYYEHGPDQAMADAPNIEVQAIYTVVDGQLVESQ
jgi:hypothetical protein